MTQTDTMAAQMAEKAGFIAALDQSGGSTPGALRHYGVADDAYQGDEAMYRLIHDMRVRIISSPAFTGEKVIGAILFEKTMDGQAGGKPVPTFLWEDRGVVPIIKVDKGLETEKDGASVLKPMPDLDALLSRAKGLGVFATKMRSVIAKASKDGVDAVIKQQFEIGAQISRAGLVPIIEPEVSIKAPDKAEAEQLLNEAITRQLDVWRGDTKVMLKLTLPTRPDLYEALTRHPQVMRVVALSGGYPRADACAKLAQNHGMIASFSRALIDDLKKGMSDAEFDATLQRTIDEIYDASVQKD